MQGIAAFLFFALFYFVSVTPAAALSTAVSNRNLQSFKLDIDDATTGNAPLAGPCCEDAVFDPNISPASGDETAQEVKVLPKFSYGKNDDDYSPRIDQYDTQLGVKVKVPVDF